MLRCLNSVEGFAGAVDVSMVNYVLKRTEGDIPAKGGLWPIVVLAASGCDTEHAG